MGMKEKRMLLQELAKAVAEDPSLQPHAGPVSDYLMSKKGSSPAKASLLFAPDTIIGRGDLALYLKDDENRPVKASEVSYSLYHVTKEASSLVGPSKRVPINPKEGEYYASFYMPSDASDGIYRIQWKFRKSSKDFETIMSQEFRVLSPTSQIHEGADSRVLVKKASAPSNASLGLTLRSKKGSVVEAYDVRCAVYKEGSEGYVPVISLRGARYEDGKYIAKFSKIRDPGTYEVRWEVKTSLDAPPKVVIQHLQV